MKMKFLFLITLVVIFLDHCHVEEAKLEGFTTDLISRDSPRSPFYNASETKYERLQKAFQQHFSAVMASPNDDIQADVIPGRYEYLMNISMGTPPVPMLGIADTGSDLIWRECLPCDGCYQQDEPLFDPETSQTYKILACDNEFCGDLGQKASCGNDNSCIYNYAYGTGDRTTIGYLSSDTVTIGSGQDEPAASFPGVAFGCAHRTTGAYVEKHVGLIGLGGGPLSLVKQLDSQFGGLFSYCLVPLSSYDSTTASSSKINFGSNGVVSGSGTVSIPLIKGSPDTFYYLKLEGMSVGSTRVELNGFSAGGREGNIFIDSGTFQTFLPPDFYSEVESALAKAVAAQPTSYGFFNHCYSTSGSNLQIPTITVHFTGADIQLPPLNTFFQAREDLFCFTMFPSNDFFIFGNHAQMNFLVGFDLNKNMVSFKPTDCTNQ